MNRIWAAREKNRVENGHVPYLYTIYHMLRPFTIGSTTFYIYSTILFTLPMETKPLKTAWMSLPSGARSGLSCSA